MIKISDRLEKIRDGIKRGESVADIGTDHGLLPLALFERDIAFDLILTDSRRGPLKKARENLDRYFLHSEFTKPYVIIDQTRVADEWKYTRSTTEQSSDADQLAELPKTLANQSVGASETSEDTTEVEPVCFIIRIGDGLDALDYAEVDTVVIAGMGGFSIIDILSKNQKKTRSFKKLILQPRIAGDKLREWLADNDYVIVREELAMEAQRINEIITVNTVDSPISSSSTANDGGQPVCDEKSAGRKENRAEKDETGKPAGWASDDDQAVINCMKLLRSKGLTHEIGEGLLRRRDPLLPEFLRIHIERNKKVIDGIRSGRMSRDETEKAARLEEINYTYSMILKYLI